MTRDPQPPRAARPGLAYRADEELRAQAGQNVIAVVDARFAELSAADKEFRATIDTRFEAIQRELALLRWMVGVGLTLISTFLAISTVLSR